VLKRLGIINGPADQVQAREWYRRAAELGSLNVTPEYAWEILAGRR
jgi:TPR repeat protein